MSNNKDIDSLYRILVLYESASKKEISYDDYLRYVYRLFVRYKGANKEEISDTLMGIYELGNNIEHSSLKSLVFHLIAVCGG